MKGRPESQCPPEDFYNEEEAIKYTKRYYSIYISTRIINVQADLAQRCIELLAIKDGEKKCILDIGCGSGISGTELTEEGHFWVGVDISADMLSMSLG